MLCKKIKYEDFEGIEREENFYFNLNEAELVEWLTTSGNYTIDKVLQKLVRSEKVKDIMIMFKDLIYISYGEKSLDGKRFMKSKEIKDAFMESNAYSELFMEIVGDPKKASEFFNAIVPAKMAAGITEAFNDPDKLPEEFREYAEVLKDSNKQEDKKVVPMTAPQA